LSDYKLRPSDRRLLLVFYREVVQRQPRQVTIVGHADQSGGDELNLELSRKRAQAVADELLRVGLAPGLLKVQWKGKFELAVPNDTEKPDGRNRRVIVTMEF